MRATHRRLVALLAALAVLSVACGREEAAAATRQVPSSTIRLENCGLEVAFEAPPRRVVALNSAAVEAVLALGEQGRVVGAVGRAESVRTDLRPAFAELPLLGPDGEGYPSTERVLETEPELVYSVYPSAFRDTGIGTRGELADLGIRTYLSPGRCPNRDPEAPLEFEEVWDELRELGTLLGAEDAAESLVRHQRQSLDETLGSLRGLPPASVFWWDVGLDEPTAGACCGAPGMIMRLLGMENAFGDLPGQWATTSWELVVERDPDVIVMVDFGGSDIADKSAFLEGDPTLRRLRAVEDDAIVVLPFPATTPGIQNADAVRLLGSWLEGRADR